MTNPKFSQVGHVSQRGLIERNGTVFGLLSIRVAKLHVITLKKMLFYKSNLVS